MLEVSGLSKTFRKVQAVKDLSFKVKSGEVLGLIGPNGAGKTTALKCMCSILRPDEGTIVLNGFDLQKTPVEAKMNLAYVPEIPNPYQFLTVEEHVEFSARIFQLKDWESRANEMIKKFDLEEKRKELVKTLSKGMKQKVNIMSAFIHEPQVILLDEPLYGIDPKGGKYIKDLVRKARKGGASVVISSHMLGLVEELADKILVMGKGEKLAMGTMDEVKQISHLSMDSRLEDVYIEITEK